MRGAGQHGERNVVSMIILDPALALVSSFELAKLELGRTRLHTQLGRGSFIVTGLGGGNLNGPRVVGIGLNCRGVVRSGRVRQRIGRASRAGLTARRIIRVRRGVDVRGKAGGARGVTRPPPARVGPLALHTSQRLVTSTLRQHRTSAPPHTTAANTCTTTTNHRPTRFATTQLSHPRNKTRLFSTNIIYFQDSKRNEIQWMPSHRYMN